MGLLSVNSALKYIQDVHIRQNINTESKSGEISKVWCNTVRPQHDREEWKKAVCVQLPASAGDVTLFVFAAERRPCSNRSVSPGCRPTAANPPRRPYGRIDRQTDARQFRRPCSAYYASSVDKVPAAEVTGRTNITRVRKKILRTLQRQRLR